MMNLLNKTELTKKHYLVLIVLFILTLLMNYFNFTVTTTQCGLSTDINCTLVPTYTLVKYTAYIMLILTLLYVVYLVLIFDNGASKMTKQDYSKKIKEEDIVIEYHKDMIISKETYDFYKKIINFKRKTKYLSGQSVEGNPGYFLEVNGKGKSTYRFVYADDELPATHKASHWWVKIEETTPPTDDKKAEFITYHDQTRFKPGVYITNNPGYYLEVNIKCESVNRICYCTSKLPPTGLKGHTWVFVKESEKDL